jgi:hypothetical protein
MGIYKNYQLVRVCGKYKIPVDERRFSYYNIKACCIKHFGPILAEVAQSVEHITRNDEVMGSIPIFSSNAGVVQWQNSSFPSW